MNLWFSLAIFGSGIAVGILWNGTISPWLRGQVHVVLDGTQADIRKLVDGLKAKL